MPSLPARNRMALATTCGSEAASPALAKGVPLCMCPRLTNQQQKDLMREAPAYIFKDLYLNFH